MSGGKITPHQTAKINRLLSKIEVQQARLERIKTLLHKCSTEASTPSNQSHANEHANGSVQTRCSWWYIFGQIIIIGALGLALMGSYLTLLRMTGPDQEQYIPLGYGSSIDTGNACWLQPWLHPSSWTLGGKQTHRHPHAAPQRYEEMEVHINATQLLVSPVCWSSLNSSVPNVIVALLEPECVCVWHTIQILLATTAILVVLGNCIPRAHPGIWAAREHGYPPQYETVSSDAQDRGDKYVSSTMRTIMRELNSLMELSGLRMEDKGSRRSEDHVPTSRVQRRLSEEFDTTYGRNSSS
eukprot:gb/GECG01009548.1/.p1 GENE.gb/GECG01009548.1/~~gb/GECG01009548.1/.p1  ORF type:complete len:298 (+),score=23.83 gb/GECG01009548.1/:1-894(+)